MTAVQLDRLTGKAEVINMTDVPVTDVANVLNGDPQMRAVADALMQWHTRTQVNTRVDRFGRPSRFGGLLERDRYLTPGSTYAKIRVARQSLADDVVGGAADGTESLAFGGTGFMVADADQEDVWNQIAADIDMDAMFRKAWRILFTDSQFVAATWWHTKSYTVRGETKKGNARTKTFDLQVPEAVTFLDALKVTPVGNLMFGREQLAYIADPMEAGQFDIIIAKRDGTPEGKRTPPRLRTSSGVQFSVYPRRRGRAATVPDQMSPDDPIVEKLILGRYVPGIVEEDLLQSDGVDTDNLFLLDPRFVFRHTLTRPDYQRFADIRLESVFPWLDLKNNARAMDRAHLLGGTNFIVLITKGTDLKPADQKEIDALRANVTVLAQSPVIVGDHRLKVEIVTPSLDMTLHKGRYDTVDSRIFARTWQTFVPTGADQEDPIKLGKVIGKGLESRRKMMRRTFEAKIVQEIFRRNDLLTKRAKIAFSPAIISIVYDPALASFILEMRSTRDVSRYTALSVFELSQADEAAHRKREEEEYDDIFKTINPHGPQGDEGGAGGAGGPAANPQRRAGGRAGGGQRKGGGAAPGSGQGQPPRKGRRTRRQLLDRAIELVEDGVQVEAGRWRMGYDDLLAAIEDAEATLEDQE